jgi:hypothetical protein
MAVMGRQRGGTSCSQTLSWKEDVVMTSKKLLLMMVVLGAIRPTSARSEAPDTAAARACCGLSADVVDLSLRPDAVESAAPLYRYTRSGRHLVGVVITYRAGIGQSPETLQYALECQLARGRANPSSQSPLGVKDATATIRTRGGRVHAEITSDRESSAAEIVRRTRLTLIVASR